MLHKFEFHGRSVMLRQFEVGGVYSYVNEPFKVTRITYDPSDTQWGGPPVWDGGDMRVRQVHHRFCRYIEIIDIAGKEANGFSELAVGDDLGPFSAWDFHCLHPFSPSGDSLCKAYLRDCQSLPEWLCRFHKDIMKTFVLFFFSAKLIVLARRVKERMCAPGGIGFIAAQESFYRAAKSQRIE